MNEQESIRDEARAYIHKKRPEWHDNGVGIVQGSHYRSGFEAGAEWALTASPVIRRIQAEALRAEAARMRPYGSGENTINLNVHTGSAPRLMREQADRIEKGKQGDGQA